MTGRKAAISAAVVFIAGVVAAPSSAYAQTFESYRCADGTSFIVGFYQYDSRAYLQIDGRAITLKKRLGLSGARYSGSGVTLVITRTGTTIRHVRRPVTACELTQKRDRSIFVPTLLQFETASASAGASSNSIQRSRAGFDSSMAAS